MTDQLTYTAYEIWSLERGHQVRARYKTATGVENYHHFAFSTGEEVGAFITTQLTRCTAEGRKS